MTTTEAVPNPGSRDAIEQGCTCPVMDNHYGSGYRGGERFVFTVGCTIHSPINDGSLTPYEQYSEDRNTAHQVFIDDIEIYRFIKEHAIAVAENAYDEAILPAKTVYDNATKAAYSVLEERMAAIRKSEQLESERVTDEDLAEFVKDCRCDDNICWNCRTPWPCLNFRIVNWALKYQK